MGKYEEILNVNYKDEVINMIKTDIEDKVKDLPKEELEHFCNNVFTVASLTANHVADQEIANQIMNLNNQFLYDCQQKGLVINPELSNEQIELSAYLSQKYMKVIEDINNK